MCVCVTRANWLWADALIKVARAHQDETERLHERIAALQAQLAGNADS